MSIMAAVLLGVAIGVSVGALGGGGSVLTVPALVYLLGEPVSAATTGSLVIVGLTAVVSTVGHARSGNVRWGAGVVFGLVGVAASHLGTALNSRADPEVLLLAFAALMLAAAAAMLRRCRDITRSSTVDVVAGGAAGTVVRGAVPTAVAAKVVAAGLVVGFLVGFLGVGGGFVIVPALVFALRYKMPVAVGTSLLVITLNSVTALLARVGVSEVFDWSVLVPFAVAAIAGSLAGKRVADRMPEATLRCSFGGLLVVVALYVATRAALTFS